MDEIPMYTEQYMHSIHPEDPKCLNFANCCDRIEWSENEPFWITSIETSNAGGYEEKSHRRNC